MDRKLIDYLPNFLQKYKEFEIIFETEQEEVSQLWESTRNALKDQFIMDATEYGVTRWERILNIFPKATDSLDDRRFRILTRMNEQLPYTFRTLDAQLSNLTGEDGYSIHVDHENYLLKVRVALVAKNNFNDVEALLHRVVPVNMLIDLSLLYNQYLTLGNVTHGQLRTRTHSELRNEVLNNGG